MIKVEQLILQLNKALKSIDEISETVTDFTEQLKPAPKEEFEEHDISALFENDIKQPHDPKDFDIKVECNVSGVVQLHRKSFIRAIRNIIRNADMHADWKDPEDAWVKFDIKEDGDKIIIDYTNNGKPFPKDISEKKFLSPGAKGDSSKDKILVQEEV